MILHLPTMIRRIRSILYMIVIAVTLWKLSAILGPQLVPEDPYRIPAGDVLSIRATHQVDHHSEPEWLTELKWFILTGQ